MAGGRYGSGKVQHGSLIELPPIHKPLGSDAIVPRGEGGLSHVPGGHAMKGGYQGGAMMNSRQGGRYYQMGTLGAWWGHCGCTVVVTTGGRQWVVSQPDLNGRSVARRARGSEAVRQEAVSHLDGACPGVWCWLLITVAEGQRHLLPFLGAQEGG